MASEEVDLSGDIIIGSGVRYFKESTCIQHKIVDTDADQVGLCAYHLKDIRLNNIAPIYVRENYDH
jgi:hypothetical protein